MSEPEKKEPGLAAARLRRWRDELAKPEQVEPIYLSSGAVESLRYALSHLDVGDGRRTLEPLTLSEAVTLLAENWINLRNHWAWCKTEHAPTDGGNMAQQAGDQ